MNKAKTLLQIAEPSAQLAYSVESGDTSLPRNRMNIPESLIVGHRENSFLIILLFRRRKQIYASAAPTSRYEGMRVAKSAAYGVVKAICKATVLSPMEQITWVIAVEAAA